jgi:lipopolysaccharide export system permease protein
MLFQSTLRRDLARSFGASFVVLLTIVMTMTLFRVLGLTTRGGVNPADLMVVMWYAVLGQLATLLSLSLSIAIVSTLSRMYRDSEMVIWFSSGKGLAGFLSPIFRFAWPVLAVIAALTLLVSPWSARQTQDMKERFEQRGDLERVTPGQFQESAGGNRVFFIDKASPDAQTGKNVFISATDRDKDAVTSAQSGRIELVGEERFLLLNNGQRLETSATDKRIKVSDFQAYGTQLGDNVIAANVFIPVASKPTMSLLREPSPINQGQLAWRIGLILAAINFIGLSVVAATSSPRTGRSVSLLFAAFAFFLVFQLLNLGQTWIATGKASFLGVTLGLHGTSFIIISLWFCKLHYNWSWWRILPTRAHKAVA